MKIVFTTHQELYDFAYSQGWSLESDNDGQIVIYTGLAAVGGGILVAFDRDTTEETT